jgi:predicted  nucleic acid-binding Zn-ribbon protein
MTEKHTTDLKELQKLDLRILAAKQRIVDFEPLLEEVELPALTLESDLATTRNRLQEMKLEERRLELGTEEKRTRQKKLEERIGSVRNLREEAAVSAELEMVKRSLQNDEQEALTLIDQLRKQEERLKELEAAFAEATKVVEPKRADLLAQRAAAQQEFDSLKEERKSFAAAMNAAELKIYDAIRAGGRSVAVAPLTEDGACGHCFGMVPLQLRNEIRHSTGLIRCESCGVILMQAEEGDELPTTSASGGVVAEEDDSDLEPVGSSEGVADQESGR